ncbi:hypothetical protein PoB_000376900 [Plakobranchus ocellatus]|uniref:Uncharacterized protein n=1 Tax=Plakobranchus ocellatus TaxID=259542 RepID=A0AAV3Y2P1_9GAST|nr:hypothetical protein PoB_000376900 [Plakobranchus ocellatus]
MSDYMREVYRLKGIKQKDTTAYHQCAMTWWRGLMPLPRHVFEVFGDRHGNGIGTSTISSSPTGRCRRSQLVLPRLSCTTGETYMAYT